MASRTAEAYYANRDVRAQILTYCGASQTEPPTAAYIAELAPGGWATPTWEGATRLPVREIEGAWTRGHDLARAIWDSRRLIFVIDLDYQNIDAPAEPFVHPFEIFFKIEPTYRAALAVFRRLGLPVRAVMTGRGYHFVGQIPLDHPIVPALAALLPQTPAWFAGVESRRPAGVTAPMTEQQARAAGGLGCLIEYAAHLILESAGESRIPVTFNGTVVGSSGLVGRECVSIDFSHVGDPLDIRHVRIAFSTYQWHLLRPDIFGTHVAQHVPPIAAVPRDSDTLMAMFARGRDLMAASGVASRESMTLPDIAEGVERLLASYEASALRALHRRFYAELQQWYRPVRQPDSSALPPCVSSALRYPNDLLLKPEHIQHVVRDLMSRGWTPAEIARLVRSVYEADHGWGNRWTARMEPSTRAEFDVRVFAGLIATHTDTLVDFNCVSAQEKNVCPRVGCPFDLRIDRGHLVSPSS